MVAALILVGFIALAGLGSVWSFGQTDSNIAQGDIDEFCPQVSDVIAANQAHYVELRDVMSSFSNTLASQDLNGVLAAGAQVAGLSSGYAADVRQSAADAGLTLPPDADTKTSVRALAQVADTADAVTTQMNDLRAGIETNRPGLSGDPLFNTVADLGRQQSQLGAMCQGSFQDKYASMTPTPTP